MIDNERPNLDGVVWLRRDALADGYTDQAIARLVRTKEWHRVRRGAYTAGELWAPCGLRTVTECCAGPFFARRIRVRRCLMCRLPSSGVPIPGGSTWPKSI